MNELKVFEKNEQAVVSSRVIAERFEKEHKNVARDVEKIIMECMAQGVYYKEIFKRCRANGEQIARFAYLPEVKKIA